MPRRRRGRFSFTAFLWAALVGNVAAGLWFSPITAPRKVRVDGTPASLQGNVRAILASMRGVPCVRVDARAIETKVQALPGIRTANLTRNVFGNAVLRIETYRPIARLAGDAGLYLSEDGVVFRSREEYGPMPSLAPPEGFGQPNFTLAQSWSSQRAAQMLAKAQNAGILGPESGQGLKLSISSGGTAWMDTPFGARIEFGTTERLDEKFAKLTELLKQSPELLSENSSVRLIAPNRPMIVPRK